jgi:hypothetical protein
MRNILFGLSFGVLLFLFCWFLLGPRDPVHTHLGVSHDVTFWIVLGIYGLVGACAFRTAPKLT